ncbi:MAG: hypothetical protein AAFY20_26740 [Cyanobacteria bacterium J06639_14]
MSIGRGGSALPPRPMAFYGGTLHPVYPPPHRERRQVASLQVSPIPRMGVSHVDVGWDGMG